MRERDSLSSGRRRLWGGLGLVLLATLGAYLPVFDNQFTNWDDPLYVLENPLIRGLDGPHLKQIFSTYLLGNYHPLTVLSYAVEYHFSRLDPFLYHLDNLLLHLGNTALVFSLVYLLFRQPLAALLAAALFGLHPLNVESVAWISERKGLLSVFFFLAALVCYVSYLKQGRLFGLRNRRLVVALLLFSCALLSKGTAVTLPVVLLLFDWFTGRPLTRAALFEKLPFFALSFLFGILALHAQESVDAIKTTGYSLLTSFSAANLGLLTYLRRLLLPLDQACFYPYPELKTQGSQIIFYGSPLLVLLLLALLLLSLKRTRLLLFGALFFLLTVAPVIQLLPVGNAITADRYTYLPYVGLFLVAGRGAAVLTARRPRVRAPLVIALVLVLGACSVLTWRRCQVFENTATLWTDVIAKQPQNPMAYNSRGEYYFNRGEYDQALQNFEQALEIAPFYAAGYSNRGAVHQVRDEWEQALADYDRSIALKPDEPKSHLNRGMVQFYLGHPEEAVRDLTFALERMGAVGAAFLYRALANEQLGRYDRALSDAQRARALGERFHDQDGRDITPDYLEFLKTQHENG